jgi:hypothetical protein
MQPGQSRDGISREQSQELMRHIGRGLRAAFDSCISEPIPPQFDELIRLIQLQAEEAGKAVEDRR